MPRHLFTHVERPDLADRIDFDVWPAYNTHGDVLNRYWRRLYEDFPEFQFVLYDEDEDVVLGEGHTIPCTWDRTPEGLPAGIDGMLELGFALREEGRAPDALSAMAIEIRPAAQGGGLSRAMLEGMREIGRRHGLGALLAPCGRAGRSATR